MCLAYVFTADGLNNIIRWGTQELRDDAELVDVIFAREQRFPLKHLSKDAPCAPNIHLNVVFLPCEHDLWGTVVPRRHVARHLWVLDACQTKVTDFQITVLIDEDIGRFEVAVDNACAVDILEAALRGQLATCDASPVVR